MSWQYLCQKKFTQMLAIIIFCCNFTNDKSTIFITVIKTKWMYFYYAILFANKN